MAELSPPSPEIVVLIAGVVLYVFIWFATRNLSRVGKILARLAPLGLVIPAMVYLSSLSDTRPGGAPMAPTTSQAPQMDRPGSGAAKPQDRERQETAAREEARRRVVMEEAQRRVQAEASRSAEQAQGARSAEAPPEGTQAPAPPTAQPRPPALPEASPPAPVPPAGASPAPPPGVAAQPEGAWDVVPVFYGTDRLRTEEAKHISYGAERARRLELGRALVTVPKTHQVPNIERPFAVRIPFTNIAIYEQAEDPKQHFTLRELKALTREQFLELVRERIGGGVEFRDQAVVFVHGYNTAFEYAVFRTAQMAYDLKFDSASFL